MTAAVVEAQVDFVTIEIPKTSSCDFQFQGLMNKQVTRQSMTQSWRTLQGLDAARLRTTERSKVLFELASPSMHIGEWFVFVTGVP